MRQDRPLPSLRTALRNGFHRLHRFRHGHGLRFRLWRPDVGLWRLKVIGRWREWLAPVVLPGSQPSAELARLCWRLIQRLLRPRLALCAAS
jgi:hypothetical protein